MRFSLLILSLLLIGCQEKNGSLLSDGPAVIYGSDTRKNQSEADPSIPAQATGLIVGKQHVQNTGNDIWAYRQFQLKQAYPLCEQEKFQDQLLLGFCSGVLVGPKHFLTAGHCIRNERQCGDALFVFNHTVEKSQRGVLKGSDIYSCKKILARELMSTEGGKDYALIELDRVVAKVTPVKIADSKSLKPNDSVINFSYPLGLPLKSDMGHVMRNESWSNFIDVAVDTFGGSSGSGIFNSKGELLGILTSGSDDFLEDDIHRVQTLGGCISFNRCDNGTCRSERFYRATLIPLAIQ